MKWIKKMEPSRVYAVIAAIFTLAAAAGFSIFTEDIKAAILGLVAALFSLVAGEATRGQVVPNAKVLAYIEDPRDRHVEIKSGEAYIEPEEGLENQVIQAAYTGRHRAEP